MDFLTNHASDVYCIPSSKELLNPATNIVPTQKQTRNRAKTTLRIIEAFEALVDQEGIDGVTIRQLTDKALVSKVLFYRYFGSLEGLLSYYISLGRWVPHYSPLLLEQLQPLGSADLAPLWSSQTLSLFRKLRASKVSRELIKVSLKQDHPLADEVSRAQDAALTRLVGQLTFVQRADVQATSAVVLGGLSYLTIQAQQNRSMHGIDLRSEAGWQRVEAAVTVIYKALSYLADDSHHTQVIVKPSTGELATW